MVSAKSRGVLSGGAILLGVLVAFIARSQIRGGEAADELLAPAAAGLDAEPTPSLPEDLREPLESPARPATEADLRTTLTTPILHGRVRNFDGEGVAGAFVVWRRLPPADYAWQYDWSIREAMLAALLARTSTTDEDGSFRFDTAPPGEGHDSAIWIHHPDYEAVPLLVPQAALDSKTPLECRFERPASLSVAVVTAQGDAMVDASVHLRGMRPVPAEPQEAWRTRAYRILARDLDVGGREALPISPPAGRFMLWARSGELESEPWFGEGQAVGRVTLALRPTFEINGLVRWGLDSPLPPDLRVGAFRRAGGTSAPLEQAAVARDGSWGPMRLPLDATWEYSFELTGDGVVTERQKIIRPTPGERVWLEFEAKRAVRLTVTVLDSDSRPIPGAGVSAWWSAEAGSAMFSRKTDSEGVAVLSGCAPTTVFLEASAPGYVQTADLSFDLSEGRDQATTVTLTPAGRIVGTCLRRGHPVPDFEITYWAGHPTGRSTLSFSQRADGSFEIPSAPLGQVSVFASSRECPRSEVQVVEVAPDEDAEVVIDLPEAITGKGQVVDIATGEPVRDARVQLYTNYQAHYMDSWGPAHPVDEAGRFEVEGFAPGDTRYAVRAEGYTQFLGQAFGVPGEVLDLGVLVLAESQPLTLKLVASGEVDFTKYRARATGNQYFPIEPFDSTGTLTYPSAGPGPYYIWLFCPDGTQKNIETYLFAGEEWTLEFPVGTGRELRVRVRGTEGRTPSEVGVTNVLATYRSQQGLPVSEYQSLSAGGEATFSEIPGDMATIEALSEEDARLGLVVARLDAAVNEVELEVGGPGLQLRVVDPHGSPIEGATVMLFADAPASGWSARGYTDSSGEYRFRSLGAERVLLNVSHPTHGVRGDIRVEPTRLAVDEVMEIELDSKARIRARFVDRGEPLAGVEAHAYLADCDFRVATLYSDSAGIVASGAVSDGAYRLVVRQPGLWQVDEGVPATRGSAPVDIEVRRLGNLSLHVQSAQSAPVKGAAIGLFSQEFDTEVSRWINEGRVPAPAGGSKSDDGGDLLVRDLPNGPYKVTCQHPVHGQTTQLITVPARGTADVTITFP